MVDHQGHLKKEVNTAYEKMQAGESVFYSQEQAKAEIDKRKAEVRSKVGFGDS